MESLSRWAFLSRPRLCKSSEFFGYPWSAVTNLIHVERGFPRKFLGIPLRRGETRRKVDDFQPSVRFFQPRELWVKLPVTKRLLDAGDFAQCLIHWQIIPSNNGKLITLGFSFSPSLVQVFRILWISLECCDQSQPCGKRISSKVFGHFFAAGGNHKEGRRFSAFSAFLSAESALSEVACHKAAFGRWRFCTVSDPLADHSE